MGVGWGVWVVVNIGNGNCMVDLEVCDMRGLTPDYGEVPG